MLIVASPSPSRRPRPSPTRRGFTLVELLVALLLLDAALLLLVGTVAMTTRTLNGGSRRARALAVAVARLERLASAPCVPEEGSAAGPLGMEERWSASGVAGSTRVITDSVAYATSRGAAFVVLSTRAPC